MMKLENRSPPKFWMFKLLRLEFRVDGVGIVPQVEAGEGSGPMLFAWDAGGISRGSGKDARSRPSGSLASPGEVRLPAERALPAGGGAKMPMPLIDAFELFAVMVRSEVPGGLRNNVETAAEDPGSGSYCPRRCTTLVLGPATGASGTPESWSGLTPGDAPS